MDASLQKKKEGGEILDLLGLTGDGGSRLELSEPQKRMVVRLMELDRDWMYEETIKWVLGRLEGLTKEVRTALVKPPMSGGD